MNVKEVSDAKLALRIAGVIAVLIGLAWAWQGVFGGNDGQASAAPPEPTTSTVKYEVSGDTRYSNITVSTPSGTSQQSVGVPIVNKAGNEGLVFTMDRGSFAYIAAQNNDDASYGPITCTITIDGVKVSENTSSGQFSIATCKAQA